jgi:hypothetical protein
VLNKLLKRISNWSGVHLLQLWIGLCILIAISVYFKGLSTYEGVQILLMVTLVLVTSRYAFSAHEQAEASKRMAEEMARPLLVPIGGRDGVARLTEMPNLAMEQRWLHVHNVGVGPATNIAIRLELRSGDNPPTVQLDEMRTGAEPLASGDRGLVCQWKSSDKPTEIYDDHWIVISYDDLSGRHFETEGQRIQESDSWVSIKTVQVKKPRRA